MEGSCEHGNEFSGSIKYWETVQEAASQEGIISGELVSSLVLRIPKKLQAQHLQTIIIIHSNSQSFLSHQHIILHPQEIYVPILTICDDSTQTIYLSICRSVCLSVCPSIRPSIYLTAYLPTYGSTGLC
jgi:hypothetical protein